MAKFLDLNGLKVFYSNLTSKAINLTGSFTFKNTSGSVTQHAAVDGTGITVTSVNQRIPGSNKSLSISSNGITNKTNNANHVYTTDGGEKDLSAYDKVVEATFPFSLTSFSVEPSIVEKGASTSVTFKWGYANSEHTVESQSIKIGSNLSSGSVTKTAPNGDRSLVVSGSDTATLFSTVNDLKCLMTATSAGKSATKENTIHVVDPSYYGILDTKTVPTSFTGLTKILRTSANTTLTNVVLANQYLIYMYPATYSDLTSITDGVLPYLDAFDHGTKTINGVLYKYYIKSSAGNITWATFTFK